MLKRITLLLSFLFSFYSYSGCWVPNDLKKLQNKCSQKKVHLTYDDGPDPNVTPRIMDILEKNGVNATFFISTEHLDKKENRDIVKDQFNRGFQVASHGHHHHAHDLQLYKRKDGKYYCDKNILSPEQSIDEIQESIDLLKKAIGKNFKPNLIRFPYGRGASPSPTELDLLNRFGGSAEAVCKNNKGFNEVQKDSKYKEDLKEYRNINSEALQRVFSDGLSHLGWNFDSHDSSKSVVDKANKNEDQYIFDTIKGLCENYSNSIVALFHDQGKPFNADTLDRMIEKAQCLGIEFVDYKTLLKEKDFLIKMGTLNEPPKARDVLGDFINRLSEISNNQPPSEKNPCPECDLQIDDIYMQKCRSSNGKAYSHCKGDKSVCLFGKWHARKNIDYNAYCSKKTCVSTWKGIMKVLYQCQGDDSKCVNGNLIPASTDLAQQVCP